MITMSNCTDHEEDREIEVTTSHLPTLDPEIYSYFTEIEIQLLNPNLDQFWLEIFERINKLHYTFDEVLPTRDNVADCYQKILNGQIRERNDLVAQYLYSSDLQLRNLAQNLSMLFMQGGVKPTLTLLEQRHQALEKINAYIVKSIIAQNPISTMLINNVLITRISQAIFDDPSLKTYWLSLEIFQCTRTKIKYLPKGIEGCSALKILECDNNEIQVFPNLVKLKNLKSISFCDNKITKIDSKNCPEDIAPSLSRNKIFHLPVQLQINYGANWFLKTKESQNIDVDQLSIAMSQLDLPKAYRPSVSPRAESEKNKRKNSDQDNANDCKSKRRRIMLPNS